MSLFHPQYIEHQADWLEFALSYRGGKKYIHNYLFKHEQEKAEYFDVRLQRAIYPNHVRAVVDTYAAHLYREAVSRETTSEVLQGMWEDMDLLGTPADELYEEAAQSVQRGGRCAIVVDKWTPEQALTRAQETELGIRPYCYVVDTLDILDWQTDRRGELVWVSIREDFDTTREPMAEETGEGFMVRVWTRADWRLYRVQAEESEEDGGSTDLKATLVETGEHALGVVPVVMCYWGKQDRRALIADSAIKDLAPMGRRLMNLTSLIDEQIYQYVFSILAVPQSTWEIIHTADWSVSGGIPFADDASKAPFYLSPDVSQIEAIGKQIRKTEGDIRQLSGLGRVNEETKHVSTGIAMSYLTLDKDALLAKFGQRMARVESQVDAIALRWMGRTEEATRTYPRSFDPLDLKDELDAAMRMVSLGVEGQSLQEVRAQALMSYLGSRVTPERLTELLDEIRKNPGRLDGLT